MFHGDFVIARLTGVKLTGISAGAMVVRHLADMIELMVRAMTTKSAPGGIVFGYLSRQRMSARYIYQMLSSRAKPWRLLQYHSG